MSSEIDSIDSFDALYDYANGDPNSSLWNGHRVTLEDANLTKCRIGGVNGINTTFQEAINHAEYISRFTSNLPINWVYNRTNGLILDGLEVVLLNFEGISPNTSSQLLKNWNAFHEENKSNPDAKYLQFCHSQGASHVKNGLADAPKEIRDRLIVVAIAPSTIIPGQSCFKSFNYASDKDFVPFIELAWLGVFKTNESGASKVLEMALEQREELIQLPAHPDASGIDHDFQSPTFANAIKGHIDDYLGRGGVYQ